MVMEILSGLGAATSLFGGLFGSRASKRAAEVQRRTQEEAANRILQTTSEANPGITEAAARTGERAVTTAREGATGVDVSAANANRLLDPYATAGATATERLNAGIGAGGEFTQDFPAGDFKADPSYQFRLRESIKALEASSAARGGATSGGAGRAITDRAGEMASTEFQAAFNRFRQQRQDNFKNVFDVAGRGQEAAGTQGTNLTSASRFGSELNSRAAEVAGASDDRAAQLVAQNQIEAQREAERLRVSAGEATAGGIVGGHNALWGGIGGAVNTATSAVQFRELMKNPALLNRFSRINLRGPGGTGGTPYFIPERVTP